MLIHHPSSEFLLLISEKAIKNDIHANNKAKPLYARINSPFNPK